MYIKNMTFNIKELIYIIMIYSFFKTYYLSELGVMPQINTILFGLTLILIVYFYLIKLPYVILDRGLLFIFMYYTVLVITTIRVSELTWEDMMTLCFSIGFPMLLLHSILKKERLLLLLKSFYILLYVYIIINLIFIILYPAGIPSITVLSNIPNHIFGNPNSVIKSALPAMCFIFIYDIIKYKVIRLKTWILFSLVWLNNILTTSVTAILGLFVFTLFVTLHLKRKTYLLGYFHYLIISIFLTLFVLFLRSDSTLLLYITDLIGKDITFSNRDKLWNNAIYSIQQSFIFGYGFLDSNDFHMLTNNRAGSHNYYLDSFLRGGLLSISMLLFAIIYTGKKLLKEKRSEIGIIITGTICAYFIMWVAEPFFSKEYLMFSILFILGTNIKRIKNYYIEC